MAHGTDPELVDEETFADICIMFNDGVIGNLGILEVLGTLTAGHFNMSLPKGKRAYTLKDVIRSQYDYLYPPKSEDIQKEEVSQNLLAFALMSPGAPSNLLKDKHG